MSDIRILPAGDCALTVEFGNSIAPEINARVQALSKLIEQQALQGVIETIPTFRSLLVIYDPLILKYKNIKKLLTKLSAKCVAGISSGGRVFHIPVCYGGEFGEDLPDVAKHTGLSLGEVIERHSKNEYLIYMLGFLPGFPYLGGLDEKLFTPRLESPRTLIPAGSVGIGGEQTGIYPLASPGGWRLIGRTPVKAYDAEREEPILYRAGDYIKFDPIEIDEYKEIERQLEAGKYQYKIRERGEG